MTNVEKRAKHVKHMAKTKTKGRNKFEQQLNL